MARREAVFLKILCVQEKKSFHARYDFAADDRWVLTYGIKDAGFSDIHNSDGNSKKIDIGQSRTGPQYRCPYCGNKDYVRCGKCKKLTCYSGDGDFECASCGNIGTVTGVIDNIEGSKGKAQ